MTLPFFLDTSHSSDDASAPRRRASESAVRWLTVHGEGHEQLAPISDPADTSLIARLRVADEGAFREAWEQYHAPLADFALRYVGSRDAAADVVQDVFVALWERHAHIELRGSLAGYLYGMVRYTAMDMRKHERIVQRHDVYMAAAYASAPIVARNLGADVIAVESLQRILSDVIAKLPPRTREIFLMSREDGLSPAAIASALGIGPQVVYNQLSRALKAIHEALEVDSRGKKPAC